MLQDALEGFYNDTRHRPHAINGPESVTLLAKKYIALHCQNNKQVFPYVSNDLQRLEKRTDGGVIKRYSTKKIDPQIHTYLFSNCDYNVDSELLNDFQKEILPRPNKEQRWQKETRKDRWKDLGLFMAFVCHNGKPEFRSHVKNIVNTEPVSNEFTSKQQFENLCKRISTYDGDIDPQELGILINSMSWNDIDNEALFLIENKESSSSSEEAESSYEKNSLSEEEKEEEEEIDTFIGKNLEKAEPIKWSLEKEAEFRKKPAIQTYKKENMLSNQFDSRKTATQIIVLGTAAPHHVSHLMKNISGKRQSYHKTPHPLQSVENWSTVLACGIDSLNLENAISHPDVRQFYRILKTGAPKTVDLWKTDRDVIKAYLTAHLKDWKDKWQQQQPSSVMDIDTQKSIERYLKNNACANHAVLFSLIQQ